MLKFFSEKELKKDLGVNGWADFNRKFYDLVKTQDGYKKLSEQKKQIYLFVNKTVGDYFLVVYCSIERVPEGDIFYLLSVAITDDLDYALDQYNGAKNYEALIESKPVK